MEEWQAFEGNGLWIAKKFRPMRDFVKYSKRVTFLYKD